MNSEQNFYNYPRVVNPALLEQLYSMPPQVRTPVKEEQEVKRVKEEKPKSAKKKLKETLVKAGTPAANHPVLQEKLQQAKVQVDTYSGTLAKFSVVLGVVSFIVMMVTINFIFASKYQQANTYNSKLLKQSVPDTSSYYFPLGISTLILYKSIKGFVASKSDNIDHVNSAGRRINLVGTVIMAACVYKLSTSITITNQPQFQPTNLIQEESISAQPSPRALWSFKFDTDEIEKYIKDKVDEAKDFVKDKVDDAKDYFDDVLGPKRQEIGEDHEISEEEKEIFEKIEEIGDVVEDLGQKEKQLIEEFCGKFPRVCKAFDLLDEEMQLRNLDCHEDTDFCKKLHQFLKYISDQYQEMKDWSLKDLAEKAKQKICTSFPSLCKRLVMECDFSDINSDLELCKKMKKYEDLKKKELDDDFNQRKQPSYRQYVKTADAFDELVKSEEKKKLQAPTPSVQLPEVKLELANGGTVAIFGIVLFASVLSYMCIFSGYKNAFNKHSTLAQVSTNPNAIVVTSEQAKQIFEEHNIDHPLVNSEKKVVKQENMTQFSSVHIQSLIDERKARKSEMTGDLEESKFGSNYMI